MQTYWHLFVAFLRCGIFGFGGGQATVPLIEHEVVNTFHWLNMSEFADAYALVNSLPGPITTKMAALVGYKVGGPLGVFVAILGIVLPSVIAVIVLYTLYREHKESKWMTGMMRGVRPVVVVLIIQVLCKVIRATAAMNHSVQLNVVAVGIAILAGVGLFFFEVHPVILILISLIFGGLFLG